MEFVTSLTTEAVSKLGALVADSTVKQVKYMISKDKIIANLKEEHAKLKAMKTKFEKIVDAERNKGFDIAPDVEDWLRKVEDANKELETFLETEANKNKKCFGGKCPDLAFNYSLGKRATKMAQEIAPLKEEEESKLKNISYPKSPPRLGSLITEDIKALESRKAIVKDVMEKLKDEKLKRISICGMGGVGKTTLVNEVIQNVENIALFDKVAMAAVSQNPDYGKIQIQIADRIRMEFRGRSVEERALELHERVNGGNKKVLIVLDDVWDKLNFRCIGLPSLEHQRGCKIVFTSRFANVCENMGSQENIHVHVLSEDEAWDLFREMAGDVVDLPNIHCTAKEVAKECGGLPLALVTVARALGREKHEWENALVQLKNSPSSSFSDVQKLVYSRIECSVDFLSNEMQRWCLMLCGLFPEDFDIPIESLLRLGVGLGVFKFDGELRKVRNLVHSLIKHLKKCFLLLDSDKPECVKVHDVVRDVVISRSSKAPYGFMVQYNAELKRAEERDLDHIKAIALNLDETNGLENGFEYPALQLLQVRSKSKESNPLLKHFYQGMDELKVLAMENLMIPTLPSFFQASAKLHTLLVEYCNVGDISVIGKELKNLQVLSFAHSNIEEIPIEIGELGSLKLLDLTRCDDLYFISPNVFKRLSRLQELYFGVINFPWTDNEEVLMELQSIANHLKVVEFQVRKVQILPKDLTFKSLENFWVSVIPVKNYFQRDGYLESNTLEISVVNYKSIKCSLMIKELVKKCESLLLTEVNGLKDVFCELDDSDIPFPLLKDLRIHSCPDVEYLVNDIGRPYTAFQQIQSLSLQNLIHLIEICNVSDHHNEDLTIKFLNLVELKLSRLPCLTGFSKGIDLDDRNTTQPTQHVKMLPGFPGSSSDTRSEGKLFSTEWMHQFPKLETLYLYECTSLKMVFDLQGNSQLNDQSNVVLFPRLKEVNVFSLRNLTNVWGNAPNNVHGFQNLRSLEIGSCGSLRYVFTPAIVKAIAKLKKLKLRHCDSLENLVVGGRDGEEEDDYKGKGKMKIVFDRLESLSLVSLKKIVAICPESYELELPSIRKLEINVCPKLNLSSLLNQAPSKHENIIVKSSSSNAQENHMRNANWYFGCTPFYSKLVRRGNANKKINETMQSPHDDVPSNSKRKTEFETSHMANLEEFRLSWCSYEFFQQEGDQTSIWPCPTIDGYLFPKLTNLYVYGCNKIRVLLSLSSFRNLECLEKLGVYNCENMEEIISQEEAEGSANKNIMLLRLHRVFFEHLPKLKAFCQGPYHFNFPSLREVKIEYCPNLEVFSQGSFHTPKLDDFKMTGLHGSICINNSDFNTAVQGFKAFMELSELEMLKWNEDVFKYFISVLEMDIVEFGKLLKLVPLNGLYMFQNVRKLTIKKCDSLVEVFESPEVGMVAKKGYSTTNYEIERMELEKLPKLRGIWGPHIIGLVSFNKLTSIGIRGCDNLKSVISHSMAISLGQLKELYVYNCHIMEHIVTMDDGGSRIKTLFPKLLTIKLVSLPMLECVCSRDYGYDIPLCDDEEEDKETNDKKNVAISFPKLQELILEDLPSLKCFCSGAYDYDPMHSSYCDKDCTQVGTFPDGNVTISTPNLHEVFQSQPAGFYEAPPPGDRFRTMGDVNLTIHYIQSAKTYKEELQKLGTFRCLKQPQHQHLLAYIMRIKSLELESCDELSICVPCNTMDAFQHLEELLVKQCGCLEDIFESNDCEGMMELKFMELHSLPKLKHVWRNHPGSIFGFQKLTKLIITECHDLKFVFPDISWLRSLQNLDILAVCECNRMEHIIHNNDNSLVPKGAKFKHNLSEIVLTKLPNLNCFCPSSVHFELLWCWGIDIKECPKMETFCYGTVYAPNRFVQKDLDEEIHERYMANNIYKAESGANLNLEAMS